MGKWPDLGQRSPLWLSNCQKYNRLNRLSLHDGMRRLCCRLASGLATFGSGFKKDFKHENRLVFKCIRKCSRNSFREHRKRVGIPKCSLVHYFADVGKIVLFWLWKPSFKFFQFQFPFQSHFFTLQANRIDGLNHSRRRCKNSGYRPYQSYHD